jgi:hypothetical protein
MSASMSPAGVPEAGALLVSSVVVQGGEAHIAGRKSPFTRITMSGVSLEHLDVPMRSAPKQQTAIVLGLDDADRLVADLHVVVNEIARATPTPMIRARGTWTWRADPPLPSDMLVADLKATEWKVRAGGMTRATVHLELTGTAVGELGMARGHRSQGAVFTTPQLAQALISSLKKSVQALRPPVDLRYLGLATPTF